MKLDCRESGHKPYPFLFALVVDDDVDETPQFVANWECGDLESWPRKTSDSVTSFLHMDRKLHFSGPETVYSQQIRKMVSASAGPMSEASSSAVASGATHVSIDPNSSASPIAIQIVAAVSHPQWGWPRDRLAQGLPSSGSQSHQTRWDAAAGLDFSK